MPDRVHEQREKGQVKHDGLGIEQRDQQGLAKVVARFDLQDRRITSLGEQHLETQPGQIGGAGPLHGAKGGRVRNHDGRHTGHRGPQQNLVTNDDAEGGAHAAGNAALAGRGDQRQVTGAGNQQKNDDGGDESAVVGDADK